MYSTCAFILKFVFICALTYVYIAATDQELSDASSAEANEARNQQNL